MVRWVMTRTLTLMLGAGVAVVLGSCGDDGSGGGGGGGGSFGISDRGIVEIEIDGQGINEGSPEVQVFKESQVAIGESLVKTLVIKNTGLGPVTIDTLKFSGDEAMVMVSVTNGDDDVPIESDSAGPVTIDPVNKGGKRIEVKIQYTRPVLAASHEGTLSIASNKDTVESNALIKVKFSTEAGNPVASISPKLIDFGQVKAGESPTKVITVTNTGADDLLVNSLLFQGHPDYTLEYEGTSWEPGDNISFDDPVLVAPSEVKTFQVRFAPLTDDPAEGKVVFYTNSSDPAHTSGILVEVKANTEGPCIQVNPKKVQFGGKLLGNKALLPVEIISCGTAPLLVNGILMKEEEGGACVGNGCDNFGLEYKTLPGFEEDPEGPTETKTLEIPVNNQATFNVVYVPSTKNPTGPDGQPIFDIGYIVVSSNAFDSELEVEVSGLGVEKACPTAVGVIQEGEQVIPQTNLHLFGDQSFAPAGAVASWKWTVQQPAGSASVFVPSDTFPNPTFETNTAGEYQFSLEVWDEAGVKSCVPWKQTVLVVPDEAIHVELLWDTPNDPDQTDQGPEAGSDVDLHFVHDQYAASGPDLDGDGFPDPWFDQPFDCFWFNAHPNWGSFDPSIDDDPGLDRDDTDGAGPENLNLNIPESTTYRVGVHYWSDHEYGPSYITLRIYIYSNLVFEVTDVKLVNHDMWDAATIDWPSAKVTLVQAAGGGYKITPNYQNPFFFQP